MYTNLAVCKGKYTINIGKFLKGMANTAPVLRRGCDALSEINNYDLFRYRPCTTFSSGPSSSQKALIHFSAVLGGTPVRSAASR